MLIHNCVEASVREMSGDYRFKMVVRKVTEEGKTNVNWEAGDVNLGCGTKVNFIKERMDEALQQVSRYCSLEVS